MKAIDLKESERAKNPLRVLLLEESVADSEDILEELRAAGIAIEPIVVANRGAFVDAIMSQDFGVVLSAHQSTDWNGLGALGELQKTGKAAPFLIVNGEMGRQETIDWLQKGVTDCVPRTQLARLPVAVKRALEEQKLREANHVYSEPWQGSLFRVYLPAIEGMQPLQGKMKAAEPARCAILDGTETILLAEDHDSVREMVRQWLVNLGYRVLCAANGEEALQLCEQETPDLAILDVVMPRMGGNGYSHGIAQALCEFAGLIYQRLFGSVAGTRDSKDFGWRLTWRVCLNKAQP